jgi:DNA-binding HxlR family transcriptional regulator
MLASKWVYLVVSALRTERKVEGITPKMLTQTLRGLERDGLVRREVFPVIPPRVEYELTDLGRNLADLLVQIRVWSERHAPDIREARAMAEAVGNRQ